MPSVSALIDWNTLMFIVIGFGAQLCDGALGMGFGSRTLFDRSQNTPMFFTALAAASGGRRST